MAGRKDRKWRNFLFSHDLQLRMISYSTIYMVLMLALTCVLMVYPLLHDMLLSEDIDVQYRAAQIFLLLTRRMIPAVAVVFFLFFIHQILITHRICGPLVNFTHTFNRLGQGDLTRKVYLRQGDFLKHECQRINEMVEGLAQRIQRIKQDNDRLMGLLEHAVANIENIDSRHRFEETLATVKTEAGQLATDLAVFKIAQTPQQAAPPDAGR